MCVLFVSKGYFFILSLLPASFSTTMASFPIQDFTTT
jgi:hypothetical protein